MNQEQIDRWVTAFHEAGHILAIHHSKHFGLTDPAVRLASRSANTLGEAGSRSSPFWTADMAREYSMISFGGYVGQMFLERLRPGWQTNQGGCDGDDERRAVKLREFGIANEEGDHLDQCTEIVAMRLPALEDLANVIYSSRGDISRAGCLEVMEKAPLRKRLRLFYYRTQWKIKRWRESNG